MAEYIFYTTEGFTQDPKGNDVENCQLMGIASGANMEDAKNHLLRKNPWIEEHGYDPRMLIGRELTSCEDTDKKTF